MSESRNTHFRLMTYNLGGGLSASIPNLASILEVIRDASPDILVVQEATDYQDADGTWFSVVEKIARAGEFGGNHYFGPTLTMKEHMHVGRGPLVDGLFNDWQDWRHGNAMFCRWGFVRLSDSSKVGAPKNVPLYQPPLYEGNRDTDPRFALLARVNRDPLFPFVVGVHLATLVGERGRGASELPGKAEQAQIARFQQTRRLLDLIRGHLLERGELVFLLGDFNATAKEACISSLIEEEAGFSWLIPANGPLKTHPKVADAVDHIFVYPPPRVVEYRCWIVDTDTTRIASDHLPVIADVIVK